MQLDIAEFCPIVAALRRTNAEKAVALLWFYDHDSTDVAMTAGELARVMVDHHVGSPHSTRLATAIRATRLTNESGGRFRLKPGSRRIVASWLPEDTATIQPAMDHQAGYIIEDVWGRTRGYIECVCRQLNGCYRSAYYDAASVMLRRLIETLIIECYESEGRSQEIKGNDGLGNYLMLKDLVDRTNGKPPHRGLNLGRDAKSTLEAVKSLGDRAAHNRRFETKRSDLSAIQSGVRTTVQELVQIAGLQRRTS